MKTPFLLLRNQSSLSSLALTLLISIYFVGCATIREPTVQLSAQIGQRINEMQELHLVAINKYFDVETKKVEDFLDNKWEPLFLKNFLGTSNILNLLKDAGNFGQDPEPMVEALKTYLADPSEAEEAVKKIVKKLGDSRKGESAFIKSTLGDYVEDDQLEAATVHLTSLLGSDSPALIILDFAEAAHEEMSAQRQLMLKPIETARSETVAELTVAYAEMIRGQSTLTGRLQAAAKLTSEKDDLLGAIGIKEMTDKVKNKLAGFSGAVESALVKVNTAMPDLENMDEDEIKGALPGIFSTELNRLLNINSANSNN